MKKIKPTKTNIVLHLNWGTENGVKVRWVQPFVKSGQHFSGLLDFFQNNCVSTCTNRSFPKALSKLFNPSFPVAGLDVKCEACQRFFRDGLTISFTKILTDEAVSGWKFEIHVSLRSLFAGCTHTHTRELILSVRQICNQPRVTVMSCWEVLQAVSDNNKTPSSSVGIYSRGESSR